MSIRRHVGFARGLLALAIAVLPALPAAPSAAETLALRGATVHPVSGPPVADAVVVVAGGVIQAVGAGVAIPAGATVVDLAGRHLYPGFVQPISPLGLVEIGSVRGTVDLLEVGENNADLRAEVAFNADSLLLPAAAAGGVLTANIVQLGGLFRGTSAAMRVDGWNWQDATLRAPTGMHLDFPRVAGAGADEEAAEADEKALEALNTVLEDARAYQRARAAGRAVDLNAKLAALGPVLDGTLPLFVHADDKKQIERALDWLAEQELANAVLVAGPDIAYLAERLAEEDLPVVLERVLRMPERRWEPYDAAYTAASTLHQAGVRFCIDDGAESGNARNLPFHAAMAAAFGLPRDVALRSVTLSAAEILGIADRVGSIEPGKEATFFAATGDPLEILTTIERVWVRGRELAPEDNHQWRLYRRYDQRPRPGVE